jgi:hypothetical protein
MSDRGSDTMKPQLEPWLEARLASATALRDKLEPLSPEYAATQQEAIENAFLAGRSPVQTIKRIDASDSDPERVRQFLRSLGISAMDRVLVLWRSQHVCVRIDFSTLCEHYDDLWYPSSDDVWVTDASRSWLLEIDHEEQITFRRRPL